VIAGRDGTNDLSAKEIQLLGSLLDRYCESELDQWERWRVNTSFGPVFVDVTREKPADVPDEAYTPLNQQLTTSTQSTQASSIQIPATAHQMLTNSAGSQQTRRDQPDLRAVVPRTPTPRLKSWWSLQNQQRNVRDRAPRFLLTLIGPGNPALATLGSTSLPGPS
jgi:hypothetical protein